MGQSHAVYFPVMDSPILKSVPWSLVGPHEKQALANHGQTLARLAERGGLDVTELAAVLEDRPWKDDSVLALKVVCERLGKAIGP
jgi:hypothetical protein